MKLVASVICRNELGRYLEPFVAHLLEFVDEIRLLDDHSEGGTFEWLWALGEHDKRVQVARLPAPPMFQHEGRARNRLLQWTLIGQPTHILAIDADEFVSDGQALRAACEGDQGNGAWTLQMEEVWKADERRLWTRQDGGWRAHQIPILWRVPERMTGDYRIQNRQLACGREPVAVRALARRAAPTGASVLHLGWLREAERAARYERYVEADGGRFHASTHLRSIMWTDKRVRLRARPWPAALAGWKPAILGS